MLDGARAPGDSDFGGDNELATYAHPPITEAVIEVRFRAPASASMIEKITRKLRKNHPHKEPLLQLEVKVSTSPEAVAHPDGYKLTSEDGADLVLVRPGSLSTSRLAPYMGWERFLSRAKDNWGVWKGVVDWREVSRVGVRFINRVDIPMALSSERPKVDDYFSISVRLPDKDMLFDHYGLQISLPQQDGIRVVVNAATVPPPLVDHHSILLDLDISKESDLPKREDALWDFIDKLRNLKNDMFERFITDKTRALFQ